jgi:caffeoyl-CoA O-methyltransferase
MGPRGVILIDNVLWSGDVLKSKDVDSSTAAIQELNRIIAADQGIKAVLVTIRDGIFVVRKA